MFADRLDAGKQLARKLEKYLMEEGVVLAVPRGGVPVAYVIAREFNFPLEVIFIKKIGHPTNKEYAIGAASLMDYFVIPHPEVSEDYIEKELKRIRSKLKMMQDRYSHDYEPADIKGKTVIVVDDGIATGNTLLATVRVLKKGSPKKVVIAAPVASVDSVNKLAKEVDDVVVVLVPERFYGVGQFYEDFGQVSDEEVQGYLDQLLAYREAG